MRAYAYTLVTTAIVLAFALAEWLAERYLSDRSRAASTAVEIAIVLVAALVFRPIHQRVEKAAESAFYKRKHQALAALVVREPPLIWRDRAADDAQSARMRLLDDLLQALFDGDRIVLVRILLNVVHAK